MKKSRFLAIIAMLLLLTVCFVACGKKHACESVCDTCDKCTDAACTEDACADKCAGHENANATTPVLTVNPTEVEMHAGEEIDLMFGVTVTDSGDDAVNVIILDDNDFDADVQGVYEITYKATNKFGNSATATRTVTVLEALPVLSLEVKANRLGEEKWQGTVLNFKNHEYVDLSADESYDYMKSGVFHNSSDAAITLNIFGDYGVVAVINENGVVIEGRDGANGKVVNADNPIRDNSSLTTLPDGSSVIKNFGKDIQIPAGGFAIVVCTGYAGTGVDADGRGFMNWNVIYTYGNVVRLTWEDQTEALTPYVDQAPVITGNGTTIYAADSEFVLNDGVLEGVTATDDNGTFDPSDDVTVDVTVSDNGGFDINVQGVYEITLSATDAEGNETTVIRKVEVTTEVAEIKIGNNSYTTLADLVAVDQDLTVLGKYLFIIYTPNYDGGINWSNGYGEAFVINKYGEVVRIYDGANGKYRDAENPDGITDATKCTAAGYLTEAFNSLADDEYLLVAPNGNGNATRAFLLSNRTIGATVTLPNITFAPHECVSVCANCGGCLDEACADTACATKCSCHKCESVCDICGLCADSACTEYYCQSKCEGHAHSCESVCQYCAKCEDSACTEDACVNKCEGHSGHMLLTIGTKKYEAAEDKWAKNEAPTASNAASKAIWIIEKDSCSFDSIATNGYGVAVVLDADNKVIRVYDGANGGYWLPSGKQASAHFTTSTFASVAYSELQSGETLVILPNGGSDGNAARQVGLDSRYLFNQVMSFTVIE